MSFEYAEAQMAKYIGGSVEKAVGSTAKMFEVFADSDARKKEAEMRLKIAEAHSADRKIDSGNELARAMEEIKVRGQVALAAIQAQSNGDAMFYANQRLDTDSKWKAMDRFLNHIDRQDQIEVMKLEKGVPSNGSYGNGNSDAVTAGMVGLLAAPTVHRQTTAAPQVFALEMPQATSSANSNHNMVPRK